MQDDRCSVPQGGPERAHGSGPTRGNRSQPTRYTPLGSLRADRHARCFTWNGQTPAPGDETLLWAAPSRPVGLHGPRRIEPLIAYGCAADPRLSRARRLSTGHPRRAHRMDQSDTSRMRPPRTAPRTPLVPRHLGTECPEPSRSDPRVRPAPGPPPSSTPPAAAAEPDSKHTDGNAGRPLLTEWRAAPSSA